MALAKVIEPQVDWSAGELNPDAKRTDDPLVKAGARQMRNWRLLNTRKPSNRPGRTALFPAEGRVDEVSVTSGLSNVSDFTPAFLAFGMDGTGLSTANSFFLCFGDGTLKIRDSEGRYIAGKSGYVWTSATASKIVWVLVPRSPTERDIVMTFPGQRPQIARWSTTKGWSFLEFSFGANAYGAKQEPFYRLAPPGITIKPSAVSGQVAVVSSQDYFAPGMVGTVIRWIEHQIVLTGYTDAQHMAGTVIEQLPVTIAFAVSSLQGTFNVGDAISTTTSPRQQVEGEVAAITVSAGVVTDLKINMFTTGQQFATSDAIVGPFGTCTASTVSVVDPGASVEWDEEAINGNRGWPGSCFFDQNRLGFCDMPGVPGGIAWGRIGTYDDFLVGANPSDPMFEIAPNRARVYFVANRSDEFILTDRGVWYIPISAANPLKPGSVQFLKVSNDAAAPVRPVETTEGLVFVSANFLRIVGIVPKYGYLNVPWGLIETSLYHSHLLKTPIALAITTSDSDFQEQYVLALNSDGTLAVGKFDVAKQWAGWLPWDGAGKVKWVSALSSRVVMTTMYEAPGNATMMAVGCGYSPATNATVAELISAAEYVDGALAFNAAPVPMRATSEPSLETLLKGVAGSNMTDHAVAAFAFDSNFLKNASRSPGINSPAVGYGNRIWLAPSVGAVKLSRLRITAPLDAPLSAAGATTFRIIGSNDASSWTTVYTSASTAGTNGEQIDVTSGIDQTAAFTYWGVDISGTSAQHIAVAQVEPFYLAAGAAHHAPYSGTGAFWWLAGGTVQALDGRKTLGPHTVDLDGNVTAIDHEDLSAVTLTAGLGWTAVLEPFIPPTGGGQDQGQRMRRRKLAKANVTVLDSSGFVFADRRVPAWFVGESQEVAAPVRERTFQFRPRGRDYDPRVQLVKDTPGPLTVLELGFEVTV